MPPKKKDGKSGGEEEEPLEEEKDLIEKELVSSFLKLKLAACAPPPLLHLTRTPWSTVHSCCQLPGRRGLCSQERSKGPFLEEAGGVVDSVTPTVSVSLSLRRCQ